MTCYAKQYSDAMVCAECGLIWDVNDPHPPRCGLVMNSRPILFATIVTVTAIITLIVWWMS